MMMTIIIIIIIIPDSVALKAGQTSLAYAGDVKTWLE